MDYRKQPIKMLSRVLKLYLSRENQGSNLVRKSYDQISVGYDQTWTGHMRDLTCELINRLKLQSGQSAIDLTCGTGFATALIAETTGTKVVGVDHSKGMLDQAKKRCESCEFIEADILEYLKTLSDDSIDVVTCCWGLGYSRPLEVLRQIRRVLKDGGKIGVIDNTLFSLREVMYCSMLAFMEQPDKLQNLMKFRFLTGKLHLWMWLKLAGLKPLDVWGGSKSYQVETGEQAIGRLRATGAAAGFEYAASNVDSDEIFQRFAEILEKKFRHNGQIPIIHRYLGGVAIK